MIEINKIILNPMFLGIFILSGVGSVYLGISSDGLTMLAGWVFFVGTVLVTIARNVPMNNRLLSTENQPQQRTQQWQKYLISWVAWNHVRTLCGVFSAALLLY